VKFEQLEKSGNPVDEEVTDAVLDVPCTTQVPSIDGAAVLPDADVAVVADGPSTLDERSTLHADVAANTASSEPSKTRDFLMGYVLVSADIPTADTGRLQSCLCSDNFGGSRSNNSRIYERTKGDASVITRTLPEWPSEFKWRETADPERPETVLIHKGCNRHTCTHPYQGLYSR
jgi:hypothetical protein